MCFTYVMASQVYTKKFKIKHCYNFKYQYGIFWIRNLYKDIIVKFIFVILGKGRGGRGGKRGVEAGVCGWSKLFCQDVELSPPNSELFRSIGFRIDDLG